VVLDEKTIGFVLLPPRDEKQPNANFLTSIRALIDQTLKVEKGDFHFISGRAPVARAQEAELSVLHLLEMNDGVIRISQRG